MYKWYAIKRILRGVVIYSILIFIFSFLFNQINEKVQRSQIMEMVRAEAKGLKNMTAEQIMAWRKDQELTLIRQYRLDRPLVERVLHNAKRVLTFDFGKSTTIKSLTGSQEVIKILGEAIPRTLLLFTTAFVINTLIGLALGLKKAQKPGSRQDKTTSLITLIIYGMPSWWLAMLLIFLFVYKIPLFPSGGVNSVPVPEGIWFVFDRLQHLALPYLSFLRFLEYGLRYPKPCFGDIAGRFYNECKGSRYPRKEGTSRPHFKDIGTSTSNDDIAFLFGLNVGKYHI